MAVTSHATSSNRPLIIGGGLAGLACAVELQKSGYDCLILEASDAVGGRVRTDSEDGFLFDRGFQVFLSAYPQAGSLLDLEGLDLRRFRPGVLLRKEGRLLRMMDPFRCPTHALDTLQQSIGSVSDKLLVGMLALKSRFQSVAGIQRGEDVSTEEFLRRFGFSNPMIDGFFRAFYGGIFLERDLRTSSRMFEFTFKMFTTGYATLPAQGMQAIPDQLAARLRPNSIRFGSPVSRVESQGVWLEDGEFVEANKVVVATDYSTAHRLVPSFNHASSGWRAVTNLYYSAKQSPLAEAIIALNSEGSGRLHNVCVPSDVSPHYAPAGQALISVSVLGDLAEGNASAEVQRELVRWFGPDAASWEHRKTYRISKALPEQLPGNTNREQVVDHKGILICGDHCSTASIEGAMISGQQAAVLISKPRDS